MKYYLLDTVGDDKDKKLVIIKSLPEEIGLKEYYLSKGKRLGELYPKNARIYMDQGSKGIKLSSLLGNTESCLIVNTEMKDIITKYSDKKNIETFSFTLYNHKKKIHSADYWIVNPIGHFDCLNRKYSDITYFSEDPNVIVDIDKFVFDSKKMKNAPDIFRIPEEKTEYFISETLVNEFKKSNFTNVILTEIEQKPA